MSSSVYVGDICWLLFKLLLRLLLSLFLLLFIITTPGPSLVDNGISLSTKRAKLFELPIMKNSNWEKKKDKEKCMNKLKISIRKIICV